MIYLDNAATTYPKPPAVMAAVRSAVAEIGANPGRGAYSTAERAGELVYRTREHVCGFFSLYSDVGGAKTSLPQNVIFTPGCTWSVNYVLKGTLRPGDHVIISDLEHNAVVRPLENLRKRGVEITRAHAAEGDPDATVRNFRAALRRNTKMIFCTHASNVFGIRLPVERLGELCNRYGLIFGIDCAQSAGVMPLGFDSVKAGYMCMPAHKGLYGIMGSGLLLIGGKNVPEPLCEGGTGSLSALRDMPSGLPDRLEPGTINLPGIAALNAGIGAIERTGREKLLRHEMGLIAMLYRQLSRINGVVLYTREPSAETHVPLLSFNVGSLSSEETAERLAARDIAVRAGFHCAFDAHSVFGTEKRGTVRICPSMFTTGRDIDTVVRTVYEIAR